MLKTIAENVAYKLIVLFVNLLGRIPLKQGQRIGAVLGRIGYRLNKRHREIAMKNLAHAFEDMPLHERKQLAIQVFENLGKVFFELAWSLGLNEKQIARYFKIEGREHIRNACAEGRGVLALTAHFGNWELLAVIGAIIGHPLSVVYRPLDFPPLERFIVETRSRFGANQIPKKKTFRRVLRALHREEIITLLMDQNVAWREGVFADFFGHLACTNKGLALLALKTGAPVVPSFLVREESGFTGKFLPPVPLIRTGDKIKDLEANTAQYNQVIEEMVRQYPDQWFWVHRRWNTTPSSPWPRKR